MFELHRTVADDARLDPMGAPPLGEAATIGSTPAVVDAVSTRWPHTASPTVRPGPREQRAEARQQS